VHLCLAKFLTPLLKCSVCANTCSGSRPTHPGKHRETAGGERGTLCRHLRRTGDGIGAMGPTPRTQGLSAYSGCTAHPIVSCSVVSLLARVQLRAQLMWFSVLVQATAHSAFVETFPVEVTVVDANVVADEKVVPGRGPVMAMEFALTLVEQLYDERDGEVFRAGEAEDLAPEL
jgi:hypothetical protein